MAVSAHACQLCAGGKRANCVLTGVSLVSGTQCRCGKRFHRAHIGGRIASSLCPGSGSLSRKALPVIVVPFHHHVPTGCCRHSGVHPGGQTPTLRYVSGPDHPLYCLQPTDRDLDTSQHHLSATRRDRGSSSRRRLLTTWHDCQDSSPAHRVWDGNECYLEHHSVLERIPVCLITDPFGRADGSCGNQRVHRRHVRDPVGPSHCCVYASPVAHHSDDPHSASSPDFRLNYGSCQVGATLAVALPSPCGTETSICEN